MRSLVFGGGGIRVIAFVGALKHLQDEGYLNDTESYYGVSAGALVGFLLAIGYSIDELADLLGSFDFMKFQKPTAEMLLNITETLGADNGEEMVKCIQEFMIKRGYDANIKFAEFTKLTGKSLYIYATNLNTVKLVEFSKIATPNARLVDALRASMSVPGWLTPVRTVGGILVDGGLQNNYPMECVPVGDRESAVGFTFANNASTRDTIDGLGAYIEQLVACATLPKAAAAIRRFINKTIVINIDSFPTFKFDLTNDDRDWLVNRGYIAAGEWINKPK